MQQQIVQTQSIREGGYFGTFQFKYHHLHASVVGLAGPNLALGRPYSAPTLDPIRFRDGLGSGYGLTMYPMVPQM